MHFEDKIKLGEFIKKLREEGSFAQADLAKALEIPRPSVSQVESGQRDLSLTEFTKITKFFGLSFEDFSKLYQDYLNMGKQKKAGTKSINKNIKLDQEKFKHLLLYILEKCGSKPNVGETVLYKLLYFCDFDYFELYNQPLTGMIYKKLQFGPVPSQSLYNSIIKEMAEDQQIRIITVPYRDNFVQRRYINFLSPNLNKFNLQEVELINKVINRLSDMSARQIEAHVHQDYPWISCELNEDIAYHSVFKRSGEFSQRDEDKDFLESGLQDAFGSLEPLTKEEYDYFMSLPDKDEPTTK